jgi:hypothetical protein
MKSILTILLVTFTMMFGFAQEAVKPKPTVSAGFSGIACLTFAKNNVFANFGGPNVRISYGKFGWSVGAYPSVRYNYDTAKPINQYKVSTMLGAGSSIFYKRYNLTYVAYFPTASAGVAPKAIHTFGIGIKLGK